MVPKQTISIWDGGTEEVAVDQSYVFVTLNTTITITTTTTTTTIIIIIRSSDFLQTVSTAAADILC